MINPELDSHMNSTLNFWPLSTLLVAEICVLDDKAEVDILTSLTEKIDLVSNSFIKYGSICHGLWPLPERHRNIYLRWYSITFFMHALTKKKLKKNLKEATVTKINHHPNYLYSLNQLKIKCHCIAKNECGHFFKTFK